ncbi:MAG: D-alanyl-D-alanine carboxypeptidase, partial [Bacteroidota bacterium]|nr:D-alanyl-D-alanine carboxypeptidase [Bacteroidota bacterium]
MGFAFLRGTIPLQKEGFVISGSIPAPPRYAGILFGERLQKEGVIQHAGEVMTPLGISLENQKMNHPSVILDTCLSPRLDSINYWFLKKSINLYGEALVKTLAVEKAGAVGTEKGVQVVRDFWIARGIDGGSIHIQDGSGLSPQNRVTTDALVKVLLYAKSRPWFHAFYSALPEINGMHMKSGAIGGARSYAGYQHSADGHEYVFAIIVNNYDGPTAPVIRKIFALLDLLK